MRHLTPYRKILGDSTMSTLDTMSANEAIELYYAKHQAVRDGDLMKLLEIKKKCPELFDMRYDAQIHDMIAYAKEFQSSARYKELKKAEMKSKLSVINTVIPETP